jgi:GR25 family glycosyltransferase involved in LPS biosynthesis
MKMYLISSKDRIISPAIKSFSQERRFELQICEGIFLQPDGNYASLVDFKKSRLRLGREITVPEIGIALAHCAVYKKLVIEGLNWAMVLEDDAMLVNQELLINQINPISSCYFITIVQKSLVIKMAISQSLIRCPLML